MSKCIKEGILTKAMLLNKYSDTGGLMSESDATALSEMYAELGQLQTELTHLNTKTNIDESTKSKKESVIASIANLRRSIATAETNFSALLNHTADSRAQNKVIAWYLLSLTKIEENGVLKPYFPGTSFEEKKEVFLYHGRI